ncbi:hypothetical protein GCM10009801_31470 [Streptomyces albiaxialis]|uniref:MFS transporter n=1 Tax=Streptomyces albiaxialis TaxID=329523 RepID=A0ABN2VXN9_9ACTN
MTEESGRIPLRFWGVLGRGALYGLAAVPVTALVAYVLRGEQRISFLLVASGAGLLGGAICLALGGFLWIPGEARRWREWRALLSEGQYEGLTVLAPTMVRVGAVGLVLGPFAYGLHGLAGGPW